MKTFADFRFKVMQYAGVSGITGKIYLSNGITISIAMSNFSYGGRNGLWELCVFDQFGKTKELKCLDNDALGYLSFKEVEQKLIEIQKELGIDE